MGVDDGLQFVGGEAQVITGTVVTRNLEGAAQLTSQMDNGVTVTDSRLTDGVITDSGVELQPQNEGESLFDLPGEEFPDLRLPSKTESFMEFQTLRNRAKKFKGRGLERLTDNGISVAYNIAGTGSDFDTQAARQAGMESAAMGAKMQISSVSAGKNAILDTGKTVKRIAADLHQGTITGKEALRFGRTRIMRQAKAGSLKIGGSGLRAAGHYATSFQVFGDDFASNVPMAAKNTTVSVVSVLNKLRIFLKNPVQAILASLKVALIVGCILVLLMIVSMIANVTSSTSTMVFNVSDTADVGALVDAVNAHRNETVMDVYRAFQGDTDPHGNAYGYTTLTGKTSNNMQHGVTWEYAGGICNDTAEIISMAAVYFSQEWATSEEIADFADGVPFTEYCRSLTSHGMDVTAKESAPYTCLPYGGCVYGYRSEGESVEIQDYRGVPHNCAEGNNGCGEYEGGTWVWNSGHRDGDSSTEWVEDGTHTVTVYFPLILPDTAASTELTVLPDGAYRMAGSTISMRNCQGSIVLGADYNLYKGVNNDWFYEPGALTVSFTVDGGEAPDNTYSVTFEHATAIEWCPGELCDHSNGHYDLNCTFALKGWQDYAEPETEHPDGDRGGSGNLVALAQITEPGTLTRTVTKVNQYGSAYISSIAARYTRTVGLPAPADSFRGWNEDGNQAWAEIFYKMDWKDLYGVFMGIKCRDEGSALTQEELEQLLAQLGIDPENGRGAVIAFALSCRGRFVYGQPTSLSGGPGAVTVGTNLDCSSFIQYCYWSLGLPFSTNRTYNYASAGDLTAISSSLLQPGDFRVVYPSGGEEGHVQMYLGGGSWVECCAGYGVCVDMSNSWMNSRVCHYFTYNGWG